MNDHPLTITQLVAVLGVIGDTAKDRDYFREQESKASDEVWKFKSELKQVTLERDNATEKIHKLEAKIVEMEALLDERDTITCNQRETIAELEPFKEIAESLRKQLNERNEELESLRKVIKELREVNAEPTSRACLKVEVKN